MSGLSAAMLGPSGPDDHKYYMEIRNKALQEQSERVEYFSHVSEDYTALKNTLTGLPLKTRHNVMVSVGKYAFFPGQLVHTNEIMVLLGDNYFVERSVPQAVDIVQRRLEEVNSSLEKEQATLRSMQMTDVFAANLPASERERAPTILTKGQKASGDGFFEIREEYISDDEEEEPAIVPASKPVAPTASSSTTPTVPQKKVAEEKRSEPVKAQVVEKQAPTPATTPVVKQVAEKTAPSSKEGKDEDPTREEEEANHNDIMALLDRLEAEERANGELESDYSYEDEEEEEEEGSEEEDEGSDEDGYENEETEYVRLVRQLMQGKSKKEAKDIGYKGPVPSAAASTSETPAAAAATTPRTMHIPVSHTKGKSVRFTEENEVRSFDKHAATQSVSAAEEASGAVPVIQNPADIFRQFGQPRPAPASSNPLISPAIKSTEPMKTGPSATSQPLKPPPRNAAAAAAASPFSNVVRERVVAVPDEDAIETSLMTRELQAEHAALVLNAQAEERTPEELEQEEEDLEDPAYLQRRREQLLSQIKPGLPPANPQPKKLSLFMQKQLGLIQ